jgi:hypothetical protein
MANTYTLIASSTVGSGGASNIDFTSIPATYTDLCVLVSARSARSGQLIDSLKITFNGSTTTYSSRYLSGDGASASSYTGNTSSINEPLINAATSTASTFANYSIYIPNYAGSNNKSVSIDFVVENNATTGYDQLVAGLWSNSSAITQITLTPVFSTLVQYSTAYLYGIKNS